LAASTSTGEVARLKTTTERDSAEWWGTLVLFSDLPTMFKKLPTLVLSSRYEIPF
jgi:hypothetical protein